MTPHVEIPKSNTPDSTPKIKFFVGKGNIPAIKEVEEGFIIISSSIPEDNEAVINVLKSMNEIEYEKKNR